MLVIRRSRRRAREKVLAAALQYAQWGWPVCIGAHPLTDGSRVCSCDRVGCPTPGAHPLSPTWSMMATAEPEALRRRWARHPDANIVLPTGQVFDIFDVPEHAGVRALTHMRRAGVSPGPVAAYGSERYLFFVATRGSPADSDEWWSSSLDVTTTHKGQLRGYHVDARPEPLRDGGVRWHCRDSYVLAPPSVLPWDEQVSWVLPAAECQLPDPLELLEHLSDACEETAAS